MKKFTALLILLLSITTISGGTNMASLSIRNITTSGFSWQALSLSPLGQDTYCVIVYSEVNYGSQAIPILATSSGVQFQSWPSGTYTIDCLRYRTNPTQGQDPYLGYVGGATITIPYPPQPPTTPTQLDGYAINSGMSMYLYWYPSSGATSYEVELNRTSPVETYTYTRSSSNITLSNLVSGSQYSYRVRASNNDGTSSYSTSFYFTAPYPTRPSNFGLFYSLTGTSVSISGKTVYVVPAQDIIHFKNKINEFRVYKGIGKFVLSDPVQGGSVTASYATLLRTYINSMSPPIPLPPVPVQGEKLDPDYFFKLQNSLNSIQ